jgi:hypothetical protein
LCSTSAIAASGERRLVNLVLDLDRRGDRRGQLANLVLNLAIARPRPSR